MRLVLALKDVDLKYYLLLPNKHVILYALAI